jgi:hypothetical protein
MFANPITRSRKYKSDFLFYFIFIQFTLTLWNPTIHPVTNDYTILDPQGQTIPSDVNIKIN